MTRVLTAVILAFTLSLVSPTAAQAAVSMTLSASPASLDVGAATTLRGTATGAKVGSVVRLQRWLGTSWGNVASRTIGSTRAYAFTITPPRGNPLYRVVKPAQLGQAAAASPGVRLTVYWQPTLTASATYALDDLNRSVTRIKLGHSGLGGVTVREWRRYYDQNDTLTSWLATGRTVTLPASGTIAVERRGEARGTEFRYVAAAAGARRAATSAPAKVLLAPVHYQLDQGAVRLRDLGDGVVATITFEAMAGQTIGMAYDNIAPAESDDDLAFSLRNPDGTPVHNGWFGSNPWEGFYGTTSVTLSQTGTYRLDVERYNWAAPDVASVDVYISTPKVVQVTDASLDESWDYAADLAPQWPGQALDLRVPVEEGDFLNLRDTYGTDWWGRARVVSLAGGVQRFFQHTNTWGETDTGVHVQAGGTLRVFYAPRGQDPLADTDDIRMARFATADIEIGGPSVGLENPWAYYDRNRWRFTGVAGDTVELFHEYADKADVLGELYDANGTLVPHDDSFHYVLPTTGEYHFLSSGGFTTGTQTLGVRRARGS